MKIKDLLYVLNSFNPEAEVVIQKDIEEHGYGHIDRIIPGVFLWTDYGNDFIPYQTLILNPSEAEAICLVATQNADDVDNTQNLPKSTSH